MQISMDELLNKSKKGTVNIIDVRDEYSYYSGHIINAKNIPSRVLMQSPEAYLNKNETYYIYCQSGSTSSKIVSILNSRGYHTYDVKGGYNNYLLWK